MKIQNIKTGERRSFEKPINRNALKKGITVKNQKL
jgi:hypothetical protein